MTCQKSAGGEEFARGIHRDRYLQPAQDDDEQPPQPVPPLEDGDDELLEDLPAPKRDMSFSVFFEPHFSQETSGFDPKTSFSKATPQALQ